MTEARRDTVLARIRAALGDRHRTRDELATLDRRLNAPPVGVRPKLHDDPLSQFITKAQANLCTVERIASLQMLVPAILRLLPPPPQKPDISVAPALAHLGWPADWSINFGAGRRTEPLSVTLAVAGIAETGSVVLRSAPASPTTLNFLPDMHVVVLRADDVVAHTEDAWARLRAEGGDWPRTVNIIAGPSRTADVGGIIVRPAHGPKSVHLVLCDS
ncbi:LutC/YkgG family protein [Hyphomicrobium nitrativorans]|uniref:LutC/YkgG family protein n=1 Tax=Hyphomicrobium nitrativorans TaxID=1427356 RepID=UPI000AB5A841|nr:LUD domain-containing protein [Hyphomicrobium nitrativorans]